MDLLVALLPSDVAAKAGLLLTFLTLLFYVAESFLGYRLIRSWISVLGFAFGVVLGYRLIHLFTDQALYAFLGAILCGVLLSVLSYRVYLVGVFLIAAYGIFQVAQTLLPQNGRLLTLAALLLGLAAGYLAVKFMRPAIIIITAFHGGVMAGRYLPLFISLPAGCNALFVGFVLGAIGMVVQFLTSKK